MALRRSVTVYRPRYENVELTRNNKWRVKCSKRSNKETGKVEEIGLVLFLFCVKGRCFDLFYPSQFAFRSMLAPSSSASERAGAARLYVTMPSHSLALHTMAFNQSIHPDSINRSLSRSHLDLSCPQSNYPQASVHGSVRPGFLPESRRGESLAAARAHHLLTPTREETMALRRAASSTREMVTAGAPTNEVGGGEGRASSGFDKRTVGALVIELSLTAVGYYLLYLSAKSLIGMMDPTKKDRVSSAKVSGGSRGGAGGGWMCSCRCAGPRRVRATMACWRIRRLNAHASHRRRRRWRRS